MGRYSKILVAVDGSEAAFHALRESFKLAAYEKCWITAVSVVPRYEGDLELVGLRDVRDSLRRPCDSALAEALSIAKSQGALIKAVCEEGEPYERIVDLAEAENCDLIIVGRTGKSALQRVLIGSVASRIIGYSHCDVVIVPPQAPLGWENILFPTDGSRFSTAAGTKAVDFAKSYGGGLTVLNVIDVPPEFYAEASSKVVDEMVARAHKRVSVIRELAEASGVMAKGLIREGREAHEAILELARETQINVIVMGSHGRTGLRRLLMGSVAEKVIGYSPCPVLVVKT